MRHTDTLFSLFAGALFAAASPCQGGLQTVQLPYPDYVTVGLSSLPGAALKSALVDPTWGFPLDGPCQTGQDCAWPASTTVGDIDNDGEQDVLVVMEQRLLLALGFVRDPVTGVPNDTYVIWAWWDPTAAVFKDDWSVDTACIGDFDGDGLNEVAALVGPDGSGQDTCFLSGGNQGSYRVAVLGGTMTADPSFGNIPRPSVLADWKINSGLQPNWTCQLLHGTNGRCVNLRVVHMTDNPAPDDPDAPREIMITDQGPKRSAVLRFDGSSLTPSFEFSQPSGAAGVGTHIKRIADLDGDGYDEILDNGVVDLVAGTNWFPATLPFFSTLGLYNHVDAIQPWDHDGDGDLELACVHDGWDFLLEGASSGGMAVSVWSHGENTQAPTLHGQSVCIGEFVAGADIFGWSAREALITPKGLPGAGNVGDITGGARWSYIYNGNSWEMAFCHPTNSGLPVAGPRDFDARNVDWDGDRTTDEIFARYGNTYEVWRVVADAAYAGPTNQDPTPTDFPTIQEATQAGAWPSYPYRFELIDSFNTGVSTGVGSNTVADIQGDYREEIVNAGRGGIEVAYNGDSNATPIAHPSPWTDADYVSRQQGVQTDTVNYQQLGALEGVEVFPAVAAVDVNGQVAFQAFAVYSNGARVNVTGDATFSAGPHGTFNGFRFTGTSYGTCAVQATVHGVQSNNAAVCRVTADDEPTIVYAGYGESYLTATAPSDLVIEVGVADRDGDVSQIALSLNGVPYVAAFNDGGVDGDRVAGDGIWTAIERDVQFGTAEFVYTGIPSPFNGYWEVQAIDASSNASALWPYLSLGAGGGAPATGVPLIPYASENDTLGAPVKLAGTGFTPDNLAATGQVTLFARAVPGEAPDAIVAWGGGTILSLLMNDSGTGADQIAGDGLWTATATVPFQLPGRAVIEFVAYRASPEGFSDAYPRLRSHQ